MTVVQQMALHKPTPMEAAQQRLNSAISRLETAARNQVASGGQEDIGELQARIEALREQNKTLTELNNRASQRIDATISRLRDVIKD